MSDIAIRVENLSKAYQIGRGQADSPNHSYQSLREVLTANARTMAGRLWHRFDSNNIRAEKALKQIIWALDDVSFDVRQGEAVGIIGRNGSGKSTLLKILSRITEPSRGKAEIQGSISSLLEVGTGFHPELTGRENVYLSGAILGMKRTEIVRKFDEIVAFSEVEKFIDTPVKHYSSGMYVRLAFAVAAHLESEILIVDEVLAVGDMHFRKKCLNKMKEASEQGRTILFVSHNLTAIRTLCQRCILLDAGRIIHDGDVSEGVVRYMDNKEENEEGDFKLSLDQSILDRVTYCHPHVQLEQVLINGSTEHEHHLSSETQTLTIEVTGYLVQPKRLELDVIIYDLDEMPLALFAPSRESAKCKRRPSGAFQLQHTLVLPRIMRGEYYLNLTLKHPVKKRWVKIEPAVRLIAEGSPTMTGEIFDYYSGLGWVLLSEKR